MAELSLTPMSASRALRFISMLTGKPQKKITGAGLARLLKTDAVGTPQDPAASLYVVNRSMFGQFTGLGPDDECSIAELRARGVKSFLLRCNGDRDVVTVKL